MRTLGILHPPYKKDYCFAAWLLCVSCMLSSISIRQRLLGHNRPLASMQYLKMALFGTQRSNAAAAAENAPTEALAAACYPDDIPFEDGPCTTCSNPCADHKQIPDYLKIDNESSMLGSMKPYKRHILFQIPGSLPSNWPPKIEEQENSLAAEVRDVAGTWARDCRDPQAVSPCGDAQLSSAAKAAGLQLGYRVMVTAVDSTQHQPTDQQARRPSCAQCSEILLKLPSGPPIPPVSSQSLLRAGEALILPDLVAIGPLHVESAKRCGLVKLQRRVLEKRFYPSAVSSRNT